MSSYLFFFRLGDMALTDPDEAFYAQTAKEMLQKGDWLTPYLYGKPQFEKPILFYWLVVGSYKLFGVNEFAARLPSAVFGFLGLLAIYGLGSVLFSKRAGLLAALMLATSVEYVMLSRACVTDMALFTLMTAGAFFFMAAHLKGKGVYYLASSAFFALATLTKGPVAIVLPLGAILLYLTAAGDLKSLKRIPLVACVLVFAAVAAPWYVYAYRVHGSAFAESFLGFHNITRFLESEHKIGSQFYYNIPIVLGGFFPWSIFLPAAFLRSFRACRRKEKSHLFALSWFLVIFIFFSISKTKLPTYIFPSFAALALIAAAFWDEFLNESADLRTLGQMRFSYRLLIVATLAGVFAAPILANAECPEIVDGAAITAGIVAFGIFASLTAFNSKKRLWAFAFIPYAMMIALYPVSKLIIPNIEPLESSKVVSTELAGRLKDGEMLGSESNYLAGLAFYTGRFPVDIDKHQALVDFIGSRDRVWCVMKEKNHRELYELDTKPYCMKPSYMVYVLGKRAIVTNKMPEDGNYLIKRERLR